MYHDPKDALQEELYQLLRLMGLMDALPLPKKSPQAEMVAAGLSQKATLPERQVQPAFPDLSFYAYALLYNLYSNAPVDAIGCPQLSAGLAGSRIILDLHQLRMSRSFLNLVPHEGFFPHLSMLAD